MFVDPCNYYPEITDEGVKDLYKLAQIVVNSHYSYVSWSDHEEIEDVAIIKALEFIKEDNYDASRSSLKNVLYTAMRNEIRNYLYRNGREVLVDEKVIREVNESKTVVDYDTVREYSLHRCDKQREVKETLQWYGFDKGVKPIYHGEVERWVVIAMYQMMKQQ